MILIIFGVLLLLFFVGLFAIGALWTFLEIRFRQLKYDSKQSMYNPYLECNRKVK